MKKCSNCSENFEQKYYFSCPACGKNFCEPCANKTKNICPNCYSSLELK